MKPVMMLVAMLACARAAAGQNADDYRGGWRTDSGEAHTYEFSIRGATVRGIYCTYCADATTLAFVDGTFGPEGIRFEVTHVKADGGTAFKDKALPENTAEQEKLKELCGKLSVKPDHKENQIRLPGSPATQPANNDSFDFPDRRLSMSCRYGAVTCSTPIFVPLLLLKNSWSCGVCPAERPTTGAACGNTRFECRYGVDTCACNESSWTCAAPSRGNAFET